MLGIDDKTIGDRGVPCQECPQLGAGRVNAYHADRTRPRSQLGDFHRHVGCPAENLVLIRDIQNRNRRSGLIRSALPLT